MTDTALITGVTGQDGFYLASRLIADGNIVVGTTRQVDSAAARSLLDLAGRIRLVEWDLVDQDRFVDLLRAHRPTQVYNLAAFTSGEFMDRNPERITDINGTAVLRMLEVIRQVDPDIRFCQASSSEVFAGSGVSPQSEDTPKVPRSVYGAAKIYADNIIRLYREKYGLFACSAFLFNHESPRRSDGFVTQKVVQAAARISLGRQEKLPLGNLSAARDWGFAGDFVRAMSLMVDAEKARDYVIATGRAYTVEDLCRLAFGSLGLDFRDHVEIDARYYRAAEPSPIVGDNSRARAELGWTPELTFAELVTLMMETAIAKARQETA